jgi:hypothetical protein
LILGILGGLAAGFLGMKWWVTANHSKASIDFARTTGVDMHGLDKLVTGGLHPDGFGCRRHRRRFLAMMGKGKIAVLLMLAGAIVPAIWAPKSLAFTCLLIIGGIVSFFGKPRQSATGV